MKTKNKTSKKNTAATKQQKKKIIVTTVAVGAAGILGYFGWQYLKRKKESKKAGDIDAVIKNMNTSHDTPLVANTPKPKVTAKAQTATKNNSTSSSAFPLQKGSKGNNVKLLQEALIAKYGKSILPKYGVDGDFGTETVNALKKAGLPATIDESMFNVITQAVKVDPAVLGKDLYNATASKNYNKALALLKKLQTTTDYSAANEAFKENRINGVRQTIVNGLLNTFKSDTQKQQIKFEFLRIGLQFNGNKWSLSGFDGRSIVTTEPTMVWVNATDGLKVPARMVLGNEITKRLDYTLFENAGKYFLVQTKTIKYL
ncbi:MAG TPA: peptidoglycan-binding domain-containing protein [Chitinophagaceae bacterium]|jgi:peptidoglycan hydrolase-like protein with peptidoglycan-binding domain|nr:peptidoglycan-binding domain-containing protein [Chitinophagaceae bacterium]